jgi:capsular polysaccharide biosynthesis protein
MELRLYLSILRRRWPIVVAIPLLVALISAAVAVTRPARYGAAARLLVTRGDAAAGSTAGLTDQREDKTAQDLPAIVSSAAFRHELAAELGRIGRPIDEAALAGALQASSQDHVVTIAAQAAGPESAVAIVQSTIELVRRNGLRYWGDPSATPDRPGLNVQVLDPPETATRLNGARAIAVDVGLRILLAAVAAVSVAFAMHYLDQGRMTKDNPIPTTDYRLPPTDY